MSDFATSLGAAIVASVEAHARELAEWTEEELTFIASTLPDGTDLRARLRVCDHLDAGGRVVRRDVRLDGVLMAGCSVEWPSEVSP